MESNPGLTFGQESFLTIRRDGELVAIERQNGHVERYVTKLATFTDTLKVFGADKLQIKQD